MTTKVVDFLNESGGSNFTETAPRPPTIGEENELQSNGGNSTKSSSSHKSHVSIRSHSSSKSGSGKGDHSHSPATTPRKSNLEGVKSSEAKTGNTHTSMCEYEDSEEAAPNGFEPEGSAANSPPYSENGTPPHLKWAENLHYLLEDGEGVGLFKEFMENELEGGSEELQFWFACQGLKRKISSNSLDTITNIQKAIYKRYVRSDKVKCISKEVKKDIADKVSSKSSLDKCIFEEAQVEVENSMRNVTYPAFLRSDYYVQYVQNYVDSPKSSQSSGSNSARPVSQSGLLPVVHEDKELESKDFSSSMTMPVINKAPSSAKRTEAPMSRTETMTGSMLYCSRPTASSYPQHVSYAPVSAQDSELQSLSSDALTDDTISVTDTCSSVDGYPHHVRKKHHRKANIMKNLAQQNREFRTGLHSQIIPRTEHAPKDRNIAETDPKRFSNLLIEKLSKLVEERECIAKVDEKLRSIPNEVEKVEGEEKLVSSLPNTSASFIPLMEEETAESILDDHCERIWASSTRHTPSYSPPGNHSPPHSKSPDRHKDARKKTQVALPGSTSTSGPYNPRGYYKKRDFMSHDSSIDHNHIVCGTETHRHIHHHHHHHHSRDSSRETCSLAWRTDTAANISADFPAGDFAGRGRTSTRKSGVGNSGLRKSSETSSNIDSGISGMESVKPTWTTSSEKVMKWMLDSETTHGMVTLVSDTGSSHRRSHRLNQSSSSTQPLRQSSKPRTSTRSTSVERGVGVLSTWQGTPQVMPSQPFAQDSSMPLMTPPNPTTQLEEAKRRLEAASPVKSKSFTGVLSKDKIRFPPGGGTPMPSTSHTRTLPSARTVPTHLDTSGASQTLDSRLGGSRVPTSAPSSLQQSPSDTIIGIYMGQEPIPYRHTLPGRAITLAQIKTLVTKRGPFKYYFKRHSDEFGDKEGAVFEEIADDNTIVPMFQGKIVVKVEKLDL